MKQDPPPPLVLFFCPFLLFKAPEIAAGLSQTVTGPLFPDIWSAFTCFLNCRPVFYLTNCRTAELGMFPGLHKTLSVCVHGDMPANTSPAMKLHLKDVFIIGWPPGLLDDREISSSFLPVCDANTLNPAFVPPNVRTVTPWQNSRLWQQLLDNSTNIGPVLY